MTRHARLLPKLEWGATVCGYSDRHACTVVSIDDKTGIVHVREDKATRTDSNGMSEMQEYSYEPNPNGRNYYFKFFPTKNKWFEMILNSETKRFKKSGSMGLVLGERDEYYDYSF